VLAFIVWNDLFDAHVRGGMYEYLAQAARYEQGLAGRVTIDEVMRPAIANGVRVATICGAAIAAFGVGAVRYASRRQCRGHEPSAQRSNGPHGI
jgi:hypothetical protein